MEPTSKRTRTGVPLDAASVPQLTNDQVVIRLLNTINHLSRWLSPIHEQSRLMRAVRRGEPSVKELVIRLRDEERRQFPRLYAIATRNNPNLDKLPPYEPSADDRRHDEESTVLEVQAEFRRLRQSTGSLLRSLPDVSWQRTGISRRDRSTTVREIANSLVVHDQQVLRDLDRALERGGARQGIAEASKAGVEEMLVLSPSVTP
jgi:hypothetical protein